MESQSQAWRIQELPLPAVHQISDVSQAQAILLICYDKIQQLIMETVSGSISTKRITAFVKGSYNIHDCLASWETAFSSYLKHRGNTVTRRAVTHHRILKAYHLACEVETHRVVYKKPDLSRFMPEFRAIVLLAQTALESQDVAAYTERRSSTERANMVEMPDIRTPFRLVLLHCPQQHMQKVAQEGS